MGALAVLAAMELVLRLSEYRVNSRVLAAFPFTVRTTFLHKYIENHDEVGYRLPLVVLPHGYGMVYSSLHALLLFDTGV